MPLLSLSSYKHNREHDNYYSTFMDEVRVLAYCAQRSTVLDQLRAMGFKLRKELATLPHKATSSGQVSSLTGTLQHTDRMYSLS